MEHLYFLIFSVWVATVKFSGKLIIKGIRNDKNLVKKRLLLLENVRFCVYQHLPGCNIEWEQDL